MSSVEGECGNSVLSLINVSDEKRPQPHALLAASGQIVFLSKELMVCTAFDSAYVSFMVDLSSFQRREDCLH